MRIFVVFANALVLFILVPAVARALPITMTPDPLGDWFLLSGLFGTRTLDIALLSGDTSPVPTVELRTSLVGGGVASTTILFLFDFDVDVASATITASSGAFGGGPSVAPSGGGGDITLNFGCNPSPCTVDVSFEFATPPTTVDVTDIINQFSDSPGAPNQTLSATFAVAPVSAPALGPAALLALGAGLLVVGRRTLLYSR